MIIASEAGPLALGSALTTECETRPLHICIISDDAVPAKTGVGSYLQLVCKELAKRNHRVTILTTRRHGEPVRADLEGIRIIRLFTVNLFGYPQALPSRRTIRKILQTERPDVIHHHYLGLLMKRTCVEARRLGIPQIATAHFDVEVLTQPLLMRPLRGILQRQVVACYNRCDLVIAPARKLVARLAKEGLGIPLRVVSNPVDFGEVDTIPAARGCGPVVLYAGRLAPEKNLPLLLGAFAKLALRMPDATLWIAGEGSLRSKLQRSCMKLGIDKSTRFLGQLKRSELARYYAACDIFVLPSKVEMLSLVALEAMWFGKPLIVTNKIICADELVDHETNGYIVDSDAPGDLAFRLMELSKDPTLRSRMGLAGRRKAAGYRLAPIVDSLEKVYRDVLS
ncbi:MAG: glycosyltransferase [Planctomycetes bacterium]|nr:glycosyltransferase [Planctomycetota bacterium]